ncbi:MAG: transposase [Gammaproteobacteria bacterium]|jgi:hypothetical protein|nr:transposase [Gammaproteobacteria bacterium]
MRLADLIDRFEPALLQRHGDRLNGAQRGALRAMAHCRQPDGPTLQADCRDCGSRIALPRSCGHRACPHCQHAAGQAWLDRQRQRRLPVDYYMVTFTLPAELRPLARQHPRAVYAALLRCAWLTLARFGRNDPKLAVELGATAVLHTHNRRRDLHPHVHLVVPAGGVNAAGTLWRKKTSKYLFNSKNLAAVFRATLLAALRAADLTLPDTPDLWVAHCTRVGNGDSTLIYLSRYLYRGVLGERDILSCDGDQVRFRYTDAKTRETYTRTLHGADFLWLLLQHVLPPRFRRTREFGLLHPRRATLLKRVQLLLHVTPKPPEPPPPRAPLRCPHCQGILILRRPSDDDLRAHLAPPDAQPTGTLRM